MCLWAGRIGLAGLRLLVRGFVMGFMGGRLVRRRSCQIGLIISAYGFCLPLVICFSGVWFCWYRAWDVGRMGGCGVGTVEYMLYSIGRVRRVYICMVW